MQLCSCSCFLKDAVFPDCEWFDVPSYVCSLAHYLPLTGAIHNNCIELSRCLDLLSFCCNFTRGGNTEIFNSWKVLNFDVFLRITQQPVAININDL